MVSAGEHCSGLVSQRACGGGVGDDDGYDDDYDGRHYLNNYDARINGLSIIRSAIFFFATLDILMSESRSLEFLGSHSV